MNTRCAALFALGIGWCAGARATNGDFDSSFGNGGIAFTGLTDVFGNGGYGPVVQPDGKILFCDTRTAVGTTGSDFFVARFDADGTLDAGFGSGGKVTIDFDEGLGVDMCSAIALQNDGHIVVAGYTRAESDDDFAVARLNPDGTPDTSFAGTGKTTIAFDLGAGNIDQAFAVAVQADGGIVVAGSAQTNSNGNDFAIARLTPNGSPDNTFGTNGKVTVGFDFAESTNKDDTATALAIDSAQRIVVAGRANRGSASVMYNDFAVARLLPNGDLDASFDGDGRATIAFDIGASADDEPFALAIQEDGRIVLAGTSDVSPIAGTTNYDMALARLMSDGSPDASFGIGGKTLIAFDLAADGIDNAVGLAEQPGNGKLYVVGYTQYDSGGHIRGAAARLDADGRLDDGFGALGKQSYDLGLTTPSSQVLRGIAITGRRVMVTGAARVPGDNTIDDFLVRLSDDLIFADRFD